MRTPQPRPARDSFLYTAEQICQALPNCREHALQFRHDNAVGNAAQKVLAALDQAA